MLGWGGGWHGEQDEVGLGRELAWPIRGGLGAGRCA